MLRAMWRHSRAIFLSSLTIVAVTPAAGRAQGAALPPAKDIISRFGQAVGGDAWKKHKSARLKATMEVPNAGMSGTVEIVQVFPNVVAQKISLPGFDTRGGYDGTVAWAIDPMQGPRLLTGQMADQMKDDADPDNALRMSAAIVSAETIDKTSMNGQDCYRVKITWKSGRVMTDCYAVSDGLLIASTTKQATPMGEVEMTQYQSGYKDFGGIKRATVMKQETMGVQTVITLTSWEWDTVDPKEIELPAEIKALVKKP